MRHAPSCLPTIVAEVRGQQEQADRSSSFGCGRRHLNQIAANRQRTTEAIWRGTLTNKTKILYLATEMAQFDVSGNISLVAGSLLIQIRMQYSLGKNETAENTSAPRVANRWSRVLQASHYFSSPLPVGLQEFKSALVRAASSRIQTSLVLKVRKKHLYI